MQLGSMQVPRCSVSAIRTISRV